MNLLPPLTFSYSFSLAIIFFSSLDSSASRLRSFSRAFSFFLETREACCLYTDNLSSEGFWALLAFSSSNWTSFWIFLTSFCKESTSCWVTTGSFSSCSTCSTRLVFSLSSLPILSLQKSLFLLTSFLSKLSMSRAVVSELVTFWTSRSLCWAAIKLPSLHSSCSCCSWSFSISMASSSCSFLSKLVASRSSWKFSLPANFCFSLEILVTSCSFSVSSCSMSLLRSLEGGASWRSCSSSWWVAWNWAWSSLYCW
mmetsp:Transcript_8846/g.13184  ORF Transcript_8846/g.13184 Transcript_8846/m.13184 type:complete len:254 (-) Transcript_8846:461-1222(-)